MQIITWIQQRASAFIAFAIVAVSSLHPINAAGFHVHGTDIIGPDGKVFVPMGGNMNGYEWGWMNNTAEHVDMAAKVWKFNTIRLNCYIKGYHRLDYRTYQNNNDMDKLIDLYTSRGIVVMIDAHDWTGKGMNVTDEQIFNQDGEVFGPNNGETLENPFDEFGGKKTFSSQYEILRDFFLYFAKKYRKNPYVWLNPMNEPGTVINNYRTKSDGRYQSVPKYWREMHGKFIEDMRAVGYEGIIVLDGIATGQDHGRWWGDKTTTLQPQSSAILTYGQDILNYGGRKQNNIVFSFHIYHQWGYDGGDKLMRDYIDAVHAKGLCLMIGEAGWYGNKPTAEPAQGYNRVFDIAVPNGVGVLVWHLQPGDGMALVDGGTFSKVNSESNPSNLTWMGKRLWPVTSSGKYAAKPPSTTRLAMAGTAHHRRLPMASLPRLRLDGDGTMRMEIHETGFSQVYDFSGRNLPATSWRGPKALMQETD